MHQKEALVPSGVCVCVYVWCAVCVVLYVVSVHVCVYVVCDVYVWCIYVWYMSVCEVCVCVQCLFMLCVCMLCVPERQCVTVQVHADCLSTSRYLIPHAG